MRSVAERCDPLLYADRERCETLALRLAGLSPSVEELVRYWTEFTGDNSPQTPRFMPDAWTWLNRLVRAGTAADWCLLLEG